MTFDIITIFPEIFKCHFKESIINKAIKKGLISINIHNLRDFSQDSHKKVDDKPYGGGRGMVMMVEPIYRAVAQISNFQFPISKNKKKKIKNRIILFTPRGKKFNQKLAYQFSKLDQLILICGRYEGVDERVAKYIVDSKISVGDFVLMGGELASLVVIETVSRLIPGVVGKSEDLLKERITKEKGFIEYPQYTRPPKFFPKKIGRVRPEVWQVPKVLLSGHHRKIEEWRKKHRKIIEK